MTRERPVPSGEEDAVLVRRARAGDERAFERLVRRHLAAAHGTALRTLRNTHDAQDVCQDAFVTALTKLEDCRHPERFRAWLLTIVRNTALNALDRERRRRTEPLERAGNVGATGGPEEDAEREVLRRRLRDGVDALPEMQRKVLVLHDYEGWSHGEIADELDIAAGTSRYHLHAARKTMRETLGRDPEEER